MGPEGLCFQHRRYQQRQNSQICEVGEIVVPPPSLYRWSRLTYVMSFSPIYVQIDPNSREFKVKSDSHALSGVPTMSILSLFTDFEPTTPETNFGISTSPADVTSVSCITNPYSLEDVPSLWERTSNFIEANEQPQWILIAPAAWMWTVPHHHSSLCVLKSVAHWAGSRQRRALFQRRSTFVTR